MGSGIMRAVQVHPISKYRDRRLTRVLLAEQINQLAAVVEVFHPFIICMSVSYGS